MFDRIISSKPVDFIEKIAPNNNHNSHHSNNVSQNSDTSVLTTSFKPKKSSIFEKILFPYENKRRKADKYIENYSALKPEINENLKKFLKSSQNFIPKRNMSANFSKELRNSPEKPSRIEHPNSLHFSILNDFLNNNERKIKAFFAGRNNNEANISSLSRIVDRNVTKNYLPINVNRFRRTMLPAGHTNGLSEEKQKNEEKHKNGKNLDEYWKTQRHDEAKLNKIFNNILKKKWEIDEIELQIKAKAEEKRALPLKLIEKTDDFWMKFVEAEKYYKEFNGLNTQFKERHNEMIRDYFHKKLQIKQKMRENSSVESVRGRLKDKEMEEFQKTLKKIESERNSQAKKIARFREVPSRNRTSFSLNEKIH